MRERVEFAGIESARDEEFTSAFGRALKERRRFYFDEALLVHFGADGPSGLVAQLEETEVAGATEVEVAVFQTEVFVNLIGLIVVHRERQVLAMVVHGQVRGHDFDGARCEFGVHGVGRTRSDGAGDFDDRFRLEALGVFLERALARAEDDLRNAFAVAEVDEGNAP